MHEDLVKIHADDSVSIDKIYLILSKKKFDLTSEKVLLYIWCLSMAQIH